jgi:hypothetical protein
MRHLPHFALLYALLPACGDGPEKAIETTPPAPNVPELVLALQGDWVDQVDSSGNVFMERWWPGDQGTILDGIGHVRAGKDTVWIEHLCIVQDAYGIHYEARIPSVNEGRPVRFALTALAGDSMVFENPAHDYPQRIVYTRTAGGWNAHVSGIEEGRPTSETFLFQPAGAVH